LAAVAAAESSAVLDALRTPPRTIAAADDGTLWIDAEDFADYGGWLLDTQFVHLMGSAYLMAAGIGTPVADAVVEFDLPRGCAYRLWVRARNWLPEYTPGTFALVVNDVRIDHVFGAAPSDEWLWESAGPIELPAGTTRMALHDLSGYYGRCDALVLTPDLDYTPPSRVEAIRVERSRLTGLSLEPRDAGSFSVIVVGAGAAGSVASLASARMGAKTALIQNRPVLGGNASIELGVSIDGAASSHPNARESGIIEEIGRIKARYGHAKMSEPFRIAAEAEPNLSIFLNQHVFAVDMADEAHIAAVRAVDTLTGRIATYRAEVFVDCTGDGWVGHFAGAEYRLGREARDEFGEDLAPESGDTLTMSGCLMGGLSVSYRAEDLGRPTPYEPPEWAAQLPPADEFGRTPRNIVTGEWWLEHRGTVDDLWHAEQARDELLRITFGYWNYIKNVWPDRQRAANLALTYVPIVDAKRESRRLVGDYILTQNDVLGGRVFEDRISYGGWPLDVHHPEGIFSGKEGPFHSNPRVPIYTIPFRCLYSVNVENLLFAGRDVSVTHMALGSVRVQGTLAALGQAAGTAAALCAQRDVTPRDIYTDSIAEFQQILLKHDQYIPEIANEDPLDLARSATASASSTCRFDRFSRGDVRPTDEHPLNMPRAVMFPTGAVGQLDAIALLLKSERAESVEIVGHLREAAESGQFALSEDVAVATATVPPGAESWVRFEFRATPKTPYAWIWLPPCEGVSWRLMSKAPRGSCRAYGGDGRWTLVESQYYAFYAEPFVGVETDCRPENVINGVTRIVDERSNLWASNPDEGMPQWLELDFGRPQTFNAIYLTFDTDLNAPHHTAPMPAECVRDYDLAYLDGERWHVLESIKDNFQRRRVHRFAAVSAARIRLVVHATNGDPSARVFEIRVYNE